MEVARCGGKVVGNARKDLEHEIGESIITQNNALNYQYMDDAKQIDNK